MRQTFTIAVATVLVAAAMSSFAKDSCSRSADVAAALMEARQSGVSLEVALDAMVSSYKDRAAKKFVRAMVIDAYRVPRYLTPAVQQRAVGDFRDSIHLRCIDETGG